MRNIYKSLILIALLVAGFSSQAQTPQYYRQSGTGQNYIPFGSGYQNYKSQYINFFTEFNAVPPSGMVITKFYVRCPTSGTTTFTNLKIGFAQQSASISGLSTGSWVPTTTVYQGSPVINHAASSWVVFVLDNPFPFDPTQSWIWDACMDGLSGSGFPVYTPGGTARRAYQSTGACSSTGSQSTDGTWPDVGFDVAPAPTNVPKIAPLANFKPKDDMDTLWLNSPSVLVNTSSYSDTNYWAITNYSGVSANGPWIPYSNPNDKLFSNNRGTWLDTVSNNVNLYYTFTTPGYYKVKLFCGNRYGSSFVEKVVYVSNALRKPKALFFSSKRTLATYDRSQLYDLSLNGPEKWKWWLDPPCYDCGLNGKNEFFFNGDKNDSASSPFLQARDAGSFKLCLAVTNAMGSDTLCIPSYFNIISGYQMCNGSDSVGTVAEGAVMPTLANTATVGYYAATCSQGFRIAPCSDSITITLDRLRLRNNGGPLSPGDSLYIKSSVLPGGGIIRRWGGNDITKIKDSLRTVTVGNSQVWVVYVPVAPISSTNPVLDSGFLVHWTSKPATYSKPTASFTCPDVVYSNYKVVFANKSTGKNMAYAWDINNDRVFGKDKPLQGIDSTNYSPSMVYNVSKDTSMTVCLKTYNCVSSDTFCKTFVVKPTTVAPFADFTVNKTTGLTTDTFAFSDLSFNGANKWKWSFSPNNVTYLGGTDSTSQNPMLFLNTNTAYSVTMVASNNYGSSISQKLNYITTISYPSPGSQFQPTSSVEDFGIVRVRLVGSVGKIDTITPLKPLDGSAYSPLYNLSKTTVYRGGSYRVEVYRGDAPQDPMNLRVWADFNRNANYLDQDELLMSSDKNSTLVKFSEPFTVPKDASIGASRLLVGASAGFSTITPYSATLGCYEEHGLIIGRDLVKPVVTLKGNAITKTELNKPYIDSGATATDNIEGDISARIVTITDIDTSHIGYYTMKYYAVDYYGNVSDTVVRSIQVEINQTGPVIVMNGSDSVWLEVRKDSYTDLGASAKDNNGTDITASMITTNNLDTATVGIYYYTYQVYDAFGFLSTKRRVIIVRDTENPTVHSRTINDTNYVIHQIKTPFDENNYLRVDDNYWQNLSVVRIRGTIDVDNPGLYTLTYLATDGSGNKSQEYTLHVRVTNTYKPTITLIGSPAVSIRVFSDYSDPKATAKDYFNKPLPVDIVIDNLNIAVVGSYSRTYRTEDEFGQWATITRTISVIDDLGPLITVLGDNPLQVPVNSMTDDELLALIDVRSIKVQDNYDPNPIVVSNANQLVASFGKPGTYAVKYDATDAYGNKAQQKVRFLQIMPNTGVANIKLNVANVQVYPNPSKGLFNIEVKQGDIRNIKVYNIAGVLVKELDASKTGNPAAQVDLSNEKEGMYLIRIETTDKTFTAKVNLNR